MKKLILALFLSVSTMASVMASASTITFSNTLPITKSTDAAKPGCQVSTQNYIFDVTMLGWNLSTSTCTKTNLFSNPGYITAGQRAARSYAQFWMTPVVIGNTFSLSGFTIKNYSSSNILYLDSYAADGTVYTTVIPASATSVTFNNTSPEFKTLTSFSIRSTNNRFDVTNIIVQ